MQRFAAFTVYSEHSWESSDDTTHAQALMSDGLSIARIELISAYPGLTVLNSGRTEPTLLLITVNV